MSQGDLKKRGEGSVRLSVAMCTYNGALYVQEQLNSIARQTRLPDELIICDDCSCDNTVELIEAFKSEAPFPVRVNINDKNIGSTKNFEKAIRLCEGRIIALSDQDDIWNPSKLERLESVLLSVPDAGLVFSDAEIVDENLAPVGSRLWQSTFSKGDQRAVKNGRAVDVLIERRNIVTGATMAFLSKFKEVVLPIPTNTFFIHDGWIALMIAAVANIIPIPETLIKYRQHLTQQIGVRSPGKTFSTKPEKIGSRVQALENTVSFYMTEIERCRAVYEKLLIVSDKDSCNKNTSLIKHRISSFEKKAAHFHARAKLPDRKLSRVPFVMRELFTRRYHCYSNGFYSCARDLFF